MIESPGRTPRVGALQFEERFTAELKKVCGTGGAVADGTVELQGDLRERVRVFLAKKGFVVKG